MTERRHIKKIWKQKQKLNILKHRASLKTLHIYVFLKELRFLSDVELLMASLNFIYLVFSFNIGTTHLTPSNVSQYSLNNLLSIRYSDENIRHCFWKCNMIYEALYLNDHSHKLTHIIWKENLRMQPSSFSNGG